MPPKINCLANKELETKAPLLHMAHNFNNSSRNFNIEKFTTRFQEFQSSNTLQDELSKLDELGQNILHLTMKNKEMFEMCLNELSLEDLPTLILNTTIPSKHNLLHSFVRFGRVETLNILLTRANEAVKDAIQVALHQKNAFDESPLDILTKGCAQSASLDYLRENDLNWPNFELEVEENQKQMKKLPLFAPYFQNQAPDALPEEQSWLNMQIVSLFIASIGITAVTVAIVAVCASALSIPTAAIIAGAGLASTLVGGIGFFAYSSRNTAVSDIHEVPNIQVPSASNF